MLLNLTTIKVSPGLAYLDVILTFNPVGLI